MCKLKAILRDGLFMPHDYQSLLIRSQLDEGHRRFDLLCPFGSNRITLPPDGLRKSKGVNGAATATATSHCRRPASADFVHFAKQIHPSRPRSSSSSRPKPKEKCKPNQFEDNIATELQPIFQPTFPEPRKQNAHSEEWADA